MEWPVNPSSCWKIPRKIEKVYEFPGEGAGNFSGFGEDMKYPG